MTDPIVKELQELGIKAYTGSPHEDRLVLSWWANMGDTGELHRVFSKSCYSLSKFYQLFQKPNWLFYREKDQEMQVCVWAEPLYSSAFVGVWVAPNARKSKSSFRVLQFVYHVIFTAFNSVIGVTKQEKLLPEHVKLGYNIVGKVDGLLDDEPAWIAYLTKESFQNSKLNPLRST